MKLSTWGNRSRTQFGLSLATEGKYYRSLRVCRDLADKNQADCGTCLCMARMCYDRLHLYEEGMEWARRALKKDDATQDHQLRYFTLF